MSFDLTQFTDPQREAINHVDGHLQLIACAGAGKTEVVAQRVAMLLDPSGPAQLKPNNIVAFTFAEKAAAELKFRIASRTRDQCGSVLGLAELYVGTIHGFCLNLLTDSVPEFLKYRVLTDIQQRVFVDRHSRASGLTTTTRIDNGQPLRRYVNTKLYVSALNLIRESNVDRDQLDGTSIMDGLEKYTSLINSETLLDYTSMMEHAIEQLRTNEDLRSKVASNVKQVFVDEYQDVNPIQERLIQELCDLGADICVIGDDDQTIHQWRGSEVRNIITFADRYPDVTQIRLEDNFRSSPGVVEIARDFIEQNADRLEKRMNATGSQAYEQGDISALVFDDPDEEAAHIVERVKDLHGVEFKDSADSEPRGLAYSDMAVLIRLRKSAKPIVDALTAAGIPVIVKGMNELFEVAEAQAARDLFYWVADHANGTRELAKASWIDANLGLDEARLDAALDSIEESKAKFESGNPSMWRLYGIQRIYMTFIESIGLAEEQVPNGRGSVVFSNLGKFSQLISDFETIHFKSKPSEKLKTFASFLEYQAPTLYDEGWLDQQYATPDAVQVMTVHQSKGMEWPVVFIPQLVRNTFPAGGRGGLGVWHVVPDSAVEDAARYRGGITDERRLFYVALTRSQKYLFCSFAPTQSNQQMRRPSEFFTGLQASQFVKRRIPDFASRARSAPNPKTGVMDVALSFSELKYFFECPYQFKLRILYGFNAPIHEALGYGKSLHDVLAEVHADAAGGITPDPAAIPELLDRHLSLPYAYPALREQLRESAEKVISKYFEDNSQVFEEVEFSEQQIEISLGDGVTVSGRIDLIRRKDTGATTIVDLKTSERSQDENVTELQLHIYVLGLRELNGTTAETVEIYELDDGVRKPRSVDEEFVQDVREAVEGAAGDLRAGELTPRPKARTCASCDYRGLCPVAA
jgi:DNA helicase-2/ATP-dependent DNA helicase PcrA